MKQLEIRRLPELDYVATEAMNTLATNLSFCGENIRCILLTSRFASEGKSSTTMNLVRTIASLGKSVVLVDADLRRSKLMSTYHIQFQDERRTGLAHYLSGQCEIEDVIYSTNVEGAYMVPVGREVSGSLQLLTTPRLKQLLDYLREAADMVVIDCPPAGVIVDALEIAKHCDGAVVVAGYNQGHMRELAELKESVNRSGCRVLGVVLNQVPMDDYKSNKYYYGGKYKAYYKSDDNKEESESK